MDWKNTCKYVVIVCRRIDNHALALEGEFKLHPEHGECFVSEKEKNHPDKRAIRVTL